jgi:hypothetical protein
VPTLLRFGVLYKSKTKGEQMTHISELLTCSLPKWPALLVVGNKVSPIQANEILIRTADFHFSSNYDVIQDLYDAMGISYTNEGGWLMPNYESLTEARAVLKNLPLNYLHNSQIVSNYIGGPHGWCNWDGVIGCNSYNIGKYPSVAEVFDEWESIAAAFPYLTLKSQLFDGEICGDNIKPLVQFNVDKGTARLTYPEKGLGTLNNPFSDTSRLFNFINEQGVSLVKFKKSLKQVKKSLNK